jgi:hypothetical protein
MRAAGHLSVKFGRVIGALASDINGLRGSVLCDGSLRFLASGEKPRLEGKSGRIGASSLARDPLIAGLTNDDDSLHAVVVTAITYRRGWDGAPAYESVVIRDPWPYNTSFQELAWREFVGQTTFLIRATYLSHKEFEGQ